MQGWLFSAQLPLFRRWPQGGDLGGSVTHACPASTRTWLPYPSICALTLLKQSWSSREQFLVWDWIQSVAVCFSEIAPASVLVIPWLRRSCPPAHLLPLGLRSVCTVSFLQSGIASAPATAMPWAGVCVGKQQRWDIRRECARVKG